MLSALRKKASNDTLKDRYLFALSLYTSVDFCHKSEKKKEIDAPAGVRTRAAALFRYISYIGSWESRVLTTTLPALTFSINETNISESCSPGFVQKIKLYIRGTLHVSIRVWWRVT